MNEPSAPSSAPPLAPLATSAPESQPPLGPPPTVDVPQAGPPPAPFGVLPPHAAGPYRTDPSDPAPKPIAAPRLPVRSILVGLLLAVGVSAVGLHYAFKPALPKPARALGARLDLAAGDVVIDDASQQAALSGTPLATGATVTTKKGARALVRTTDGAAIFLRGESTLKLLDRGVELVAGEAWVDAPISGEGSFTITSGGHSVSASDAGIDVRRDDKGVVVYVGRGLAVLTSKGGRVEIGAGEQAKSLGDAKPVVSSVSFWNDWTGGMVEQRSAGRFVGSGSGRLYGLDPSAGPGAPAKKLGIAKQIVHAVVRDGVAETEVDQTFSNPGGTAIEGYYWFTIPAAATVTGFALETNGQLVEGEVIERREAAARYEAAVRQANDPALLEWVDGRTYRARIFPIPASGSRRIVLRYTEMLPTIEGKTRYVYPMRSDDPVRFDELSLSVDVGGGSAMSPQESFDLASSLDARVEPGGHTVSMRRSGFVPRADFQLEIAPGRSSKPRPKVAAWRFQAGADQADYVMLRWVPDKDFTKLPPTKADVVVVVDTSAGGDEASRQLRFAAAESTLRALSEGDRFALVALDVSAKVIYPSADLAPATEAEIGRALEKLADHGNGGATDVGAMFEPALARLHGKEQAAVVYVGDGAPTSGETGGEALLERLRRSLSGSRARFFAIGTGSSSSHELLSELTRAGGGQYVRVDEAGQTTAQSLRLASAIKTPVITDLSLDLGAGLDQPLYSVTGKIARGEELVLLARTHHPLPEKVTIHGRFASADFEDKLDLKVDTSSVTASQVPRLWAAEYARRLMGQASASEDNRSQILQLGAEYGLITPYTSSLALEDEGAYARQGITRHRSRLRGVRLTSIERPGDDDRLMKDLLPGAPPAAMMGCDAPMKRSAPAGATATESSDDSAIARPSPSPAQAPAQPVTVTTPVTDREPPAPPAVALGAGAAPLRKSGRGDEQAASGATHKPRAPIAAPADRRQLDAHDPSSVPEPKDAPEAKTDAVARKIPAPASPSTQRAVRRALSLCSDVASRPLSERAILWQKRARKASGAEDLAAIYDGAYGACELPDWRDEAALLDILGQRVETEQTAEAFLAHLAHWPEGQRFVARNILRRTVDVRIAAAVARALHGGVDWDHVDRELASTDSADKQLTIIKAAMLAAPSDPQGDLRYVGILARAGQRNEAIAHGRRLRDRGFMTPTLAQQLGDVLAEAGATEEAMRTYSEIVEFDGQSRDARRLLGDIYLRQGWHAAAYRQYKTLTDLDPRSPLAWLRLANAAAGAGRVDEALHLEHDVAGGEGTPGPNDPRVFARLLSASRLASLLARPANADPENGATPEAIGRKLKELSLFSGPGTLALLTWDDLDAKLVLGAADVKKEALVGEASDAGSVGLYAVLNAPGAWENAAHAVRHAGDILRRPVRYRLHVLAWDGTKLSVSAAEGELEAGTKQRAL